MYGGLFGDLPSAKKPKKDPSSNDNKNAANEREREGKGGNSSGEINNNGSQSKGTNGSKVAAVPAKGNLFAPPRQATKANKSQFLQMVGKSGTTMAFVPTAALKSKRKKPPVVNSNKNDTSSSNNNNSSNNPQNDETTKKMISATPKTDQQSSFAAATTTTTTTTRIAATKTDQTEPAVAVVVDIHGTGDALGTATNTTQDDEAASEERITDPYDPFVPNDLLEYWDTLAAKKHREKLERDTGDLLEQQKSMRKQLEEERKALLKKAASGGTDSLGRGRGRGLSNLPAWLVEKQRKENEAGGNLGSAAPSMGRGRGVSNLPAWLVEKQRKEAASGP